MIENVWENTSYGQTKVYTPPIYSVQVHKVRSIRTLFDKFSKVELKWPALGPGLNSIGHFWNKLACLLQARSSFPKSVPDLINTLLVELEPSPTGTLEGLVEILPRRVGGYQPKRVGG